MHDRSFGILPFRLEMGQWQVLMIRQVEGHWGFPKGHGEKGETSLETASRELEEETALVIVRFLSLEPLTERYIFKRQGRLIHKQVDYYPALVTGDASYQLNEIKEGAWLSLEDAANRLTFPEAKGILQKAIPYLESAL